MAVRNYVPIRYDNNRLFYIVELLSEMTTALGANGDIALHIPSGDEWIKRGGVWVITGRRFGADLLNQAQGIIDQFVQDALVEMGNRAETLQETLLANAEIAITEKFDAKSTESYNAFVASLDAELEARNAEMVQQVQDLIDRAITQADINGMIQGNINQAIQEAVDSSTVLDEKISEKVEELAPVYIENTLTPAVQAAKESIDVHAAEKNAELDEKLPVMLGELQTFIDTQTEQIQNSKIVWRGNYSSTMQYQPRDLVYYLGSAWIATATTLGTAPPTLPATSNNRWEIMVRQGDRPIITFATEEETRQGVSTTVSIAPFTYKLVTDSLIAAAIESISDKIDEVREFPAVGDFPQPGVVGKLYIAANNNKIYRWNGTQYAEISSSIPNTDSLNEGLVNKYFTDGRVRAATLFGYAPGANTPLVATDTILGGLAKLQTQISAIVIPDVSVYMRTSRYDPSGVAKDVYDATNMAKGVFNEERIPNLDTSKIPGLSSYIEEWVAENPELINSYVNPQMFSFKGDGVTTVFHIDSVGATPNSLNVFVDGIYQSKATFTFDVATRDIEFSEAPPVPFGGSSDKDNVEVMVVTAGIPANMTAYDLALADGFVGTKEEWIASLKGETGDLTPEAQALYDLAMIAKESIEETQEEVAADKEVIRQYSENTVLAASNANTSATNAAGVLTNVTELHGDIRNAVAKPLVTPANPVEGQLWWDGAVVRVYNGISFVPTVTASLGGLRFEQGTFGASPTGVITVGGGFNRVMVFQNGVLLEEVNDYTQATPTVTYLRPVEGDSYLVWGYQALDGTDYPTKEEAKIIATGVAVRYDAAQSLTTAQKTQGRNNIDAFPKPTGNTGQYIRGDGSTATMNSAAVGLGNVANTAPADLPVSNPTWAILNLKADKTGTTFTGPVYSDLAGNGPTAMQLKALGATSSTSGSFNISPIIKLKIPRGNFSDGDGAYGSIQYEENVGTSNQLTFRTNGFSTNRYWQMRDNGGFYAEGPVNGSAKNFEIDHTVDPDNYDLRHCAIESSQMIVLYFGTGKLVNGKATINVEEYDGVMPGTYVNLWTEAWVTAVQNQDGYDRIKPSRINGSTFEVTCENDTCEDVFTWEVKARRYDPYVLWKGCDFTDDDGRLIIEFEKPE